MTSNLIRLLYKSCTPTVAIVRRWSSKNNQITIYDPFAEAKRRDKKTYLELVKIFEDKDVRRRGHVEFIYAALARMHEFDVHKDLEVYKALLHVLPKGRFIPTNIFQSEFMHYPKQQQCAVDLLEQMEDNGVMPDSEMQEILLNVFGRRGIPLRKFWRMMYWMPKFKNLSPWYLPQQLPDDTMELALLAIKRITSVDPDMNVEILQTDEIAASIDNTWVVTAQSPAQRVLLAEQPVDEPLVIQGPYRVYLRDQPVTYFTLIGKVREPEPDDTDYDDVSKLEVPNIFGNTKLPSVKNTTHEQDDGTIVAVCATGTSSRDSLLSWIRLLEHHGNPKLDTIPVIFTLLAPINELSVVDTEPHRKVDSITSDTITSS